MATDAIYLGMNITDSEKFSTFINTLPKAYQLMISTFTTQYTATQNIEPTYTTLRDFIQSQNDSDLSQHVMEERKGEHRAVERAIEKDREKALFSKEERKLFKKRDKIDRVLQHPYKNIKKGVV